MARRRKDNCFYCGRPTFGANRGRRYLLPDDHTIDHVIPRNNMDRYGPWLGRMRTLNRVSCCHECNNRKGSMQPENWINLINPDYRPALLELIKKLPQRC